MSQGERNADFARFQDGETVGDRVADRVARFGGSWTFITVFIAVLAASVGLNTLALARIGPAFDPRIP